ncbi:MULTISPECIES: lipocalin-like domain-containing protein [Rufibacter]|uniref:Lipocalin-like domain-containing protein n=1 Tax=Rufibacter quisquiliarum TaxID=1549639 RepID=A0A839GKI4_9BACT|nr:MULTISPECIES: DUF4923 family protein [Rufibacter]MBA9075477.1 hypothetical protein [Rufibacter quisquiliarum]
MKKRNVLPFQGLFTWLVVLCLSVATISCGGKDKEGGNTKMISGDNSKTWKANKETNSAGDKEKLSSQEKKEQVQFFANGSFNQTSSTETASGTWTYDASTKTLSLTYANNNVSQNFNVTELTEDEMTLQGPDGSTLELEAE